jgi:hypothetical protein
MHGLIKHPIEPVPNLKFSFFGTGNDIFCDDYLSDTQDSIKIQMRSAFGQNQNWQPANVSHLKR